MKEKIFPLFEEKHQCRIKAAQIEAGDIPSVLQSMTSAGRVEIDVFAQDNMRLAPLVENNLVMDLTPYAKTIPAPVEKALLAVGYFNRKLFFMPYRPNVQIVYYNKKIFDKYNLAPPKDWDELLASAKFFKQKEGVGRVLFKAWGNGPTATQLYEFIVSAGGDPFTFNHPGTIKTFEFLQQLWPYLSRDSLKAKWNTANDYIARESVYLMQNWPFGIKIILQDYKKKDIATYHGFSGPAREAHVIGGEVLAIPRLSRNKDLALQFISFMQSKEIQEMFINELGWPSIRGDVYGEAQEWMKPHYQAVKEALRYGVFRQNVPYWSDFDRYINEAFVRVVIRGESAPKTLNEYAVKMHKIIQKHEKKDL
ncbi:MAG: extracellular solute-binding protein [bacterium]